MEISDVERTRRPRHVLAVLVIVLSVAALWAATAMAGSGSSAPAKQAPTGDGAGKAYEKDRSAGIARHDGSGAHDGNCPGRAAKTGASQV